MIKLDHTVAPYIFTGTPLACLCTISFLKGINSVFIIYNGMVNRNEKPQEDQQRRSLYHEVFKACAWLGLSSTTFYLLSRVRDDFLDVSPLKEDPNKLAPYASDLESYEIEYADTYLETDSLRNFCLASMESTAAYKLIHAQEDKSSIWFKRDPLFLTARFALDMVEEFKQNAQHLRSEIERKEKKLGEEFSVFQEELRSVPVAKGVSIDFTQLCETPFGIFKSTTCTNYRGFKSHIKTYEQLKLKVDAYENKWLSARQQEQCKKEYNFDGDFSKILSREHLDELEDSRRSFLSRAFRWVNLF